MATERIPSVSHAGIPQKQPPPISILDRFRTLLVRRSAAGVAFDDVAPPLTTEEVVAVCEVVHAELVLNSKPIITDLTIIAGEQMEHAQGLPAPSVGGSSRSVVVEEFSSLPRVVDFLAGEFVLLVQSGCNQRDIPLHE